MSRLTMTIRPLVLALAMSSLALGGCQPQGRKESPPPVPVEPGAAAPPPVAAPPQPVLSRADLILALEAAASDFAAGRGAGDQGLVGRRFVVRQAFGCLGPGVAAGESDGLATWSWSADQKAIEISLKPGDWIASPLLDAGADKLEAAEGFWLTRPWLRGEGCSAVPDTPKGRGAPPAPQTLAVVALFDEGASRLGRRGGRAYTHRIRAEDDRPVTLPLAGFRLVLEGRLGGFSRGDAIRCRADGPDQRPVCVAAVQLDRVAFETADQVLLSEWRGG